MATETGYDSDVIVIGGGPAGSTAATMLARKGWQVLLFEREHFPREHVGESLLPATLPVLEELGVLPAVQEAGFLPKWGATMVWGSDTTPWSWYFQETNQRHPHAYQVWRPHFDHLLLDNSRQHGVVVREGVQVVDVLFEAERAVGVRYLAEGTSGVARARFIVDASGQGALLGRRLDLRRWDPFFQNLAVYGYFTNAERLPEPDHNNIFIEAYPHGWFWHIPLHTGRTSVGVVVDSDYGQQGLRQSDPTSFFFAQIAQAPYSARMLAQAQLVAAPVVLKDWSYFSERLVGNGYILVGDAACFVDPLFSSGVHLACMAGVLGAAYITTVLKDPTMQEATARVYTDLYTKEYAHFHGMAQLFYTSNRTVESYFWEARRLLGVEETMAPRHAFIHAVAGQSPRGYERVVLERGEAPPQFVASVQAVEAERATRRQRLERLPAARDVTHSPLYPTIPRLAAGVVAQRQPVLADGEFVWGAVLRTAGYPEGLPCSQLVAYLVMLMDGQRSVTAMISRLKDVFGAGQPLEAAVLNALHILYVDGTIAEFVGLPAE